MDNAAHAVPVAHGAVPTAGAAQLPLLDAPRLILHAAIRSLALDGAERIPLDQAAFAARRQPVRLPVLQSTSVAMRRPSSPPRAARAPCWTRWPPA